jgi:hypothetical protein
MTTGETLHGQQEIDANNVRADTVGHVEARHPAKRL